MLSFSIKILLIGILNAQSIILDENKVMDFFQNQQFDDAISYLSPFAVTDSASLQLLSFLGYANYMNDDAQAAEKYYLRIFSVGSNISVKNKNNDL